MKAKSLDAPKLFKVRLQNAFETPLIDGALTNSARGVAKHFANVVDAVFDALFGKRGS